MAYLVAIAKSITWNKTNQLYGDENPRNTVLNKSAAKISGESQMAKRQGRMTSFYSTEALKDSSGFFIDSKKSVFINWSLI